MRNPFAPLARETLRVAQVESATAGEVVLPGSDSGSGRDAGANDAVSGLFHAAGITGITKTGGPDGPFYSAKG
jgi:hypothetical protein